MDIRTEIKQNIFSAAHDSFDDIALKVFNFQAVENPVYQQFLGLLNIKPDLVEKVSDIPFLPVQLFKNHRVVTGGREPEIIFESSRTSGIPSLHYVADTDIYRESVLRGFRYFFGEPQEYVFLALLPSYLERSGSSLIYMTDYLMRLSNHPLSGYFLNDFKELNNRIAKVKQSGKKLFLIGVAFALIDFAAEYQPDLSGHIVMETGGMKGRRKELLREELHAILKQAFNIQSIASEYGMTEMLSQAYALKDGFFHTPPWLRIFIRESNDPFSFAEKGQAGGINVIDFANIDSCSFIALQDLGRQWPDGSFEVLGRFDNSEIRGCSQMYS
jgi:phenylacetate-coenzyme A ligase PaaK-like adenylate-forming protein